ncbi:hypothetical protein IX38_22485 [Chryseobacterium luteum]|uniref:Uncharacterized protein n=1 Tax=Chryseobacterium luteum TaxID=421531 RepID=A0A085YXN4_9FLAO|nr:hypothetical protein IX38_22485 [Chryseobacterium luteum]
MQIKEILQTYFSYKNLCNLQDFKNLNSLLIFQSRLINFSEIEILPLKRNRKSVKKTINSEFHT